MPYDFSHIENKSREIAISNFPGSHFVPKYIKSLISGYFLSTLPSSSHEPSAEDRTA